VGTKARDPWSLPQAPGVTAWFANLGVTAGRPLWRLIGVEHTTLATLVRLLCTIDTRRSSEQQAGWMQSLIAIGAFKSGLFVFLIAWLLRKQVGTDAIYALQFVQTFALCALVVLNFHADALVDGDDMRILGATPTPARTVYASRCVFMGAHALVPAPVCALHA
jgi:small-conductance mechanosensitive channel